MLQNSCCSFSHHICNPASKKKEKDQKKENELRVRSSFLIKTFFLKLPMAFQMTFNNSQQLAHSLIKLSHPSLQIKFQDVEEKPQITACFKA